MKISNIVLCLIPSVALAAESEQKQAVALPPSAHNLPSASSPELTAPSSIEDLQSDPRIYDQFGNDWWRLFMHSMDFINIGFAWTTRLLWVYGC